jgi:hypothetical protein
LLRVEPIWSGPFAIPQGPEAGKQQGLAGLDRRPLPQLLRSGWSDAAYKSSIHLLSSRDGMSLSDI